MNDSIEDEERLPFAHYKALGIVAAGVLLVGLVCGFVLFLKKPPPPPLAEIGSDRQLLRGREIYQSRCISCHGPKGYGDGPIAKGLKGPQVGNLSDEKWKHGENVVGVVALISEGVKDTSMPAWGKILDAHEIYAVTAYVYYLGNRNIPPALRSPY